VAAQSYGGAISLLDIARPDDHPSYRLLPVPVAHAVFTPDNRSLVAAEWDGGISQWDLRTLHNTRRWLAGTTNTASRLRPLTTALAPDGTKAVTSDSTDSFTVRDLVTGQTTNVPANNTVFDDFLFTENGRFLLAVQNRVTGERSPDPRLKDTAVDVQIFDTFSWQLAGSLAFKTATTFERPTGVFTTGHPNSLVSDIHGVLKLWDVTRIDAPAHTLRSPQNLPALNLWFSSTVSPDRRWFAAGHAGGSVFLWDLQSSQISRVLDGHTHFLRSLAFSPDGTRLATANMGGKPMKLWELEDGEELITLPGEGFAFRGAAFSPDGRFLMARNRNGVLHLWSAPSWSEITPAAAKPASEAEH
jgi:WD40 repeat protein